MGTLIFVSGLVSILLALQVVRPVAQYNNWRRREEYDQEVRLYKLRVIRRFYPSLLGKSYDEIDRMYGVDRVYHTVGRNYLSSYDLY